MGYIEKLPRHEQEKRVAGANVDQVIRSIEEGRWRFDNWSRAFVCDAVTSLHNGLYRLAACEARLAHTPLSERSSRHIPAPAVTISQVRRAFDVVMASPAREFPTF